MRLVLVSALLLSACSGGSSQTPAVEARAVEPARVFVDRLIGALERSDTAQWSELLSERMRLRFGADQAALHQHLVAWRRDLLPLAAELRHADVALETSGRRPLVRYSVLGGESQELALVALEGGALHLDEH